MCRLPGGRCRDRPAEGRGRQAHGNRHQAGDRSGQRLAFSVTVQAAFGPQPERAPSSNRGFSNVDRKRNRTRIADLCLRRARTDALFQSQGIGTQRRIAWVHRVNRHRTVWLGSAYTPTTNRCAVSWCSTVTPLWLHFPARNRPRQTPWAAGMILWRSEIVTREWSHYDNQQRPVDRCPSVPRSHQPHHARWSLYRAAR